MHENKQLLFKCYDEVPSHEDEGLCSKRLKTPALDNTSVKYVQLYIRRGAT